jgi:aspartate aminotransferase
MKRPTDPPTGAATAKDGARRGLSTMARGLVGSEILRISADIRLKQAAGAAICNLTVGDFSSQEFPIPRALRDGTLRALEAGETNYPPSDGMLRLREAVRAFYRSRLGLDLPLESVLIAGGSRPVIYATYRALVEPGDTVVYPVPSWNNNHYCHLSGARQVPLVTRPEDGFLPTAAALEPHLREARLLALNTPLNPAGTVLAEREVRQIAELVVAENRRREQAGERPLYILYDQVYWMLTFGQARHFTPTQLVPASAPYTVYIDGISKAFAATGLRVGWGVGPPTVIRAMSDLLGHVGAWAPRPEQVATAELLRDEGEVDRYHEQLCGGLRARLDRLYRGIAAMAASGLPVRAIAPQGAIYLSAQFDLAGRHGLHTNDDVRRYLLDEAGFAVVPFQAFGLVGENGWFRLSVGAVSERDIEAALPRVEAALRKALA